MTFSFRTLSVLLLLTSVLACSNSSQDKDRSAPPTPLVEAVQARFGAFPVEEKMPGVVRARNQVLVRPELSGRIVEVLVRSGEAVDRGQVLLRIDDRELREQLRQAQADVQLAEAAAVAARARTAEIEARTARARALAEKQLVSAQDLESLEAQLAALRASAAEAAARVEQRRSTVDERRSALDKARVRAPVAGNLGERRAEIGMQVDSSTVLFVLGDLDELIVEINLTEAVLARVDVGLPVILEGRARGSASAAEPLRAEISRISPFLAEESFTTIAEIDVDNRERRLRPGMFVTVKILVGKSSRATLVPLTSIWRDPATGKRGVFVVEDFDGLETPPEDTPPADSNQPRSVFFRLVEVLAEGQGAAGVTGIEEGDWVVTVGQQLLEESEAPTARVRPVSWRRVLDLQDLQDEDLLEGFLDKQRKIAAALGTEIPASEDAVDEVLARSQPGRP